MSKRDVPCPRCGEPGLPGSVWLCAGCNRELNYAEKKWTGEGKSLREFIRKFRFPYLDAATRAEITKGWKEEDRARRGR